MKQIIYQFLVILLLGACTTSCTDQKIEQGNSVTLPNGEIRLNVTANIPVPKQVVTRDIDPDGLGVKTLWLFCFNEYGEYIGRREASGFQLDRTEEGINYYSFTVEIPGSTRIIHFLSNVYLDDFNDRDNYGRNETTIIPAFVSASGRMCYWGRVKLDSEEALTAFAESDNVTLYRNQAKVKWDLSEAPSGMKIHGYGICNRRAWGTIAPFNHQAENGEEFAFSLESPYITEPAEIYQMLASDPTEATVQGKESDGDPHYIFENPNTMDAPVYAIMRISTDGNIDHSRYYKIMFVDDTKDQLPIYRNYEYVIRIKGLPQSMGYGSFAEAKEGIAANNAWVSVDPEIPELTDGENTVNILKGTTQIFTSGGNKSIAFTYTGSEEDISVKWLEDGRNVSNSEASFSGPDTEGNYSINIELNAPTGTPRMGTLLLRTGVFTRQIKVYLMRPFSFNPVWVSTGVPMEKGERMSMTFVVPDTYPAELFPFECKISTNKMNANSELSGELPIVMEDTKFRVGSDSIKTTWGYKYVYTVLEPGIQEVFFTLNTSDGTDQGVSWKSATEESEEAWGDCPYGDSGNELYEENHGHVFLQAENFEDAHRLVSFQGSETNRRITINGSDSNNPGFLEMDVPPTVNQEISITLNFSSAPENGTLMRVATTATEPDNRNLYLTDEQLADRDLPTSNGLVKYYYYQFGYNASTQLTLHFVTTSSDVEDLIRFSIDQENNMNADDINLYKSAGVKLTASPARFDFNTFTVDDDNPDAEGVKYGLDHPITVSFSIPEAAVQYNDVTFLLETQHLTPAESNVYPLTPAEGGYRFTVPQGTTGDIVLHFLTNRIANGETVTIDAVDNTALFNPASYTYSNTPIEGTLALDGADAPRLNTNSFITLERVNGTRVGIITVDNVDGNNVASYHLDLRTEYDFTMDETLTIYYNSLGSPQQIYQATTTFQTLVDDAEADGRVERITLKKP
ncbi:hypothetical protein [Bacteroides sp. An51A]|uniref:hypothetical protein n=1 Tax=Bacteroides sp. An51A TaxID=1965640 RepID=UPI000B38F2EC|nr:hypothetical protein [Bacteroides sp. An51A]OUN80408.1 hypothetical protein B5G04_08415 [Bacteroides sp. An51A]